MAAYNGEDGMCLLHLRGKTAGITAESKIKGHMGRTAGTGMTTAWRKAECLF